MNALKPATIFFDLWFAAVATAAILIAIFFCIWFPSNTIPTRGELLATGGIIYTIAFVLRRLEAYFLRVETKEAEKYGEK